MSNSIVVSQEKQDLVPSSDEIEALLKESCRTLTSHGKRKAGQPATVSWTQLCLSIVLCFWQGWTVQVDVWRLVCGGIVGLFAPGCICDQAIYNRLARAADPMKTFFEQVSAALRVSRSQEHVCQSLTPFACQILAFDQCTLDQVARWLEVLRTVKKGSSNLLAGQLNALFDVTMQQWAQVDLIQGGVANRKARAQEVIEGLHAGTLLLFDRGYFSFAWFDELTTRGRWWISRYANNASFEVVHTLSQGDGIRDVIVFLGVHRSDQAQHPVRLLEYWHHQTHYRYLSNVLDPSLLSMQQVVQMYGRRWDIEMAFRLLKDYVQLKELWSAKWSVVQVQVWTGLVLGQLYHAIQMRTAWRAGVEPFEVSMPLLVKWVPRLLHHGHHPIDFLVRWGRDLRIIRPRTRCRKEVPWIDPCWTIPPPPDVLRPREKVRHAHRTCGPQSPGSYEETMASQSKQREYPCQPHSDAWVGPMLVSVFKAMRSLVSPEDRSTVRTDQCKKGKRKENMRRETRREKRKYLLPLRERTKDQKRRFLFHPFDLLGKLLSREKKICWCQCTLRAPACQRHRSLGSGRTQGDAPTHIPPYGRRGGLDAPKEIFICVSLNYPLY